MIKSAKVIEVVDVELLDGTRVLWTRDGQRLAVVCGSDIEHAGHIPPPAAEAATVSVADVVAQVPRRRHMPPPFDPTGPTLRPESGGGE